MIISSVYSSPCGDMILASEGDRLIICDWACSRIHRDYVSVDGVSHVIEATARQLDAYFAGDLHSFTIPTDMRGTSFQKSVWNLLYEIPYGDVCTYRDIARRLGRESAVRAVAAAIGRNPISIICPCHRVIGSDGSLTGYAGGLDAKKYLLQLERLP